MSQGKVILTKIVLSKTEKFRNAEGVVCEVDVRGDRTRKGTYFKVKDIGKVFGVKRLHDDITNKRSAYHDGEHYIKITADVIRSGPSDGDYYFTSNGLYMWLFKAEGVKTKHYIDWMMDTLFTVQFGTQEEKEELVGVSRQELDDTEITELREKVKKLRIQKRYIAKEWRKTMMTLGYVQQTLTDMGG